MRALAERATVAIGVDSAESAMFVARHTGGAVAVLVEVDSGHHRSGAQPAAAGEVAVAAARAGLQVRGVFTFPGHSYGLGMPQEAAAQEAAALAEAAGALRAAGVAANVLSGGSSPSAALTDDSLTEIRPGVYVFNDAQQVELDACGLADVALTAVATVVSRADDHIILDAGSKVLGADRPIWTTGFGRLPDSPGARVTALGEHHATVTVPAGTPLPDRGTVLRVMPNHVCSAANLADELVVLSGGTVVDRWPVAARGANT